MLCDAKALRELGYSAWFIKGVKRAGNLFGDNPFFGRYVYEDDLNAWLHRHPAFVASQALRTNGHCLAKDNPVQAPSISAVGDHHAGMGEAPPTPQPEHPGKAASRPSPACGVPKAPRKRFARRSPVVLLTSEWETCRHRILERRRVGKSSVGAA
jgi:hypothetical protein